MSIICCEFLFCSESRSFTNTDSVCSKISGPYLVTYHNRTCIFEWCGFKSGHPKEHVIQKDWTT